ncbi:MAG: ATP-binding protein [Bacteroidota bacterium]
MQLIGREKEIAQLDKVFSSSKSEFVALYGRRRVGKTFLVREYFNYQFDFQLTGLANANTAQQLTNFLAAYRRQSNLIVENNPTNWFDAFQLLIDHLENLPREKRKVIFFDELPWMDTAKSDFMMALEHFWNSWATNRKDVLLITCGSAASWMINHLIGNHGGLHNRVTERIKVYPFTLRETEALLKSKNNVLGRYQILQLYMVMGGIPYYLDAVASDKSASQNIEALCFQKGALLQTEFQNLYASLFKNANRHETIIGALAQKIKGHTRKEIIKMTGLPSGGTLTLALDELEESGFITSYHHFGKNKTQKIYRLSDFYSMFYFKFIKNSQIFPDRIWENATDHPSIRAWSGYAFEQVCLAHIAQIKKALGIEGVLSYTSSWKSKAKNDGAQIDIVIDRRDQVVNICEVKFSINPYIITSQYAKQLRNKIGTFKNETKTRKSLFLTMLTTFGLEQNEHANSLVQNELTLDDLFIS